MYFVKNTFYVLPALLLLPSPRHPISFCGSIDAAAPYTPTRRFVFLLLLAVPARRAYRLCLTCAHNGSVCPRQDATLLQLMYT